MREVFHSTSRLYSDQAAVAANQNVKEKNYWLKTLSGDFEKSHFFYDKKDVDSEHFKTSVIEVETFRLSSDLSSKIIKISNGIDHKLHMVLLAGLVGLLAKYTGREDIIIGSPILRQDREADFINTILVIRTHLSQEMTFKKLLMQVKEAVISATKNQNFPMDVLPEMLKIPPPSNPDESSLFDIALLLNNIHDKSYLKKYRCKMLFAFQRIGEPIDLELEYNSSLYRRNTITQIINHFIVFLEKGLSDLEQRLGKIDILTEGERQRLLIQFNSKSLEYPKGKSFYELFLEQVERRPNRIALIGNKERGLKLSHISYKQLSRKSDHWACQLKVNGVGQDTIVGIMARRSLKMVIAVLAVMNAGGAYLPIDPEYPDERVDFILRDSRTKILLLENEMEIKKEWIDQEEQKKGGMVSKLALTVLELECLDAEAIQIRNNNVSDFDPINLAYVIYTSGSTGNPKGVMVQHNHFINVALGWRKEYRLLEMEVILLQMASFSFDVFAGDLARTFINGGQMVINPDRTVAPETLYRLIVSHCITLFESTPSYILPFMRYVYEKGLPIDSVSLLILGSDSCPVQDFKELLIWFGTRMRIVNSYGVTEATIDCSYYEEYKEENIPLHGNTPIGKPLPNMTLYILDSAGNLMPLGAPGELGIGGASITRGYLNNPELTSERFLIMDNQLLKNRILYRTGDLARWLSDGNMEFLGRMDYQVKVRGYRIELGEIESKLLDHPDIKEAIVIQKGDEVGDKYLCGYIVSEKKIDASKLRDFLKLKLPEYMVPWFFVSMESFPLSPNGKIDRKALPDPDVAQEVQYIPPGNEIEKKLVDIWQEIFGKGGTNESSDKSSTLIGIDHRFFDLGGNSLKAIMMMSKIHQIFDVKVSLADIFTIQTIKGLAKHINELEKDLFLEIENTEEKDCYGLSSAQERIYVLQQMSPNSIVYNMSQVINIRDAYDENELEGIAKSLIRRHESLRTSFEIIDGKPMQRIYREVDFKIELFHYKNNDPHFDFNREAVDSILKKFIRPFDISSPPLFRIGVVKIDNTQFILLLDLHHIISDAMSMGILAKEFLMLKQGEHLPRLRLQYKDYSTWQRRLSENGGETNPIKQQEIYWLKRFTGPLPQLDLLYDFLDDSEDFGMNKKEEGEVVQLFFEKERTDALREIASSNGATLQMVTTAIFFILLAKLSGKEDIIIGTSVVGRRHIELENIMGIFTNTLALRNFPSAKKTFRQFLYEVKDNSLNAYENQDYPFEELVKKLPITRDINRNPLFDIMFEIQVEGRTAARRYENGNEQKRTAKFGLDWLGFEDEEGSLFFNITFKCNCFKRETIEFMAECYRELTDDIIGRQDDPIQNFQYSSYQKDFKKVDKVEFDF